MKQASSNPAAERPAWGRRLLAAALAAALVTAILIVFLPAMDFAFLYYDDDRQILDNPFVKQLSLENVSWIFTHFCITSYYPVRLLSYAVDYRFWGANPRGYHLTNTAIHAADVLLLFWLLVRLGRGAHEAGRGDVQVAPGRGAGLEPAAGAAGYPVTASPAAPAAGSGVRRAEAAGSGVRRAGAAGSGARGAEAAGSGAAGPRAAVLWRLGAAGAAAGILAVHPLVVEPVVWVPGREELLMTFFVLGCIHCHLSGRQAAAHGAGWRRAAPWHVVSAVAAALACLCNVVGAVAPLLALAYDLEVARLRRVGPILAGTGLLWAVMIGTIVLKQIGETLPAAAEAVAITSTASAWQRGALALDTFRQNLAAIVWPQNLSLKYPRVRPDTFFSAGTMLGIGCGVALLAVLWLMRRRRMALFGLLWFGLTLAPTSQIIPHHIFRADRFLYLPLAGVAVLAAAGLAGLADRGRARWALAVAAAAVLPLLAAVSVRYVAVWRDGTTLFEHCLSLAPSNPEIHNELARVRARSGDDRGAVAYYRQALALAPAYASAHSNLAESLLRLGELDEAIAHLARAAELSPRNADMHSRLGVALMTKGLLLQAQQHLEKAVELAPDCAVLYDNLGLVLARQGKMREACRYHRRALAVNPNDARAHCNLGTALMQEQQYAEALAEFQAATALDAGLAPAFSNRGLILMHLGRLQEAVRSLQEAVRLQPDSAEAWNNLGCAMERLANYRAAAGAYGEGVRLNPQYAACLDNLARLLATCPDGGVRNGRTAVPLAERACAAPGGPNVRFLDTLAAAYAEAGRFDEAVAAAERAIEVAQALGRTDLANEIRGRLVRYQGRQPLRQTQGAGAVTPGPGTPP